MTETTQTGNGDSTAVDKVAPVTRRKFLKRMGVTTAGVTLASFSPWMEAVSSAMGGNPVDPKQQPEYAEAFRLLTAATFGPTQQNVRDVLDLDGSGLEMKWRKWLDAQMWGVTETLPTKYMQAICISDIVALSEFRRQRSVAGLPPTPANSIPVCDGVDPHDLDPGNPTSLGYAYDTLDRDANDQPYNYLLNRNGSSFMYDIALNAPDQLRQRVAYALSQIFVISDTNPVILSKGHPKAEYWEVLSRNAFGDFYQLLDDVVRSPLMGLYLDHRANPAVNPNENMARELLQLFTIGKVDLNMDGTPVLVNGQEVETYGQADVKALARVLTGLFDSRLNDDSGPLADVYFGANGGARPTFELHGLRKPMRFYSDHHDKGQKHILGQDFPLNSPTDPDVELEQVLRHLVHHPNTAPFICRRLIQNLTTSNPTMAYVKEVASVFHHTKGDLGQVVKAIFTSKEFLDPPERHLFGKTKDPLIRHLGFLRAVGFSNAYELGNYPRDAPYNHIADAGLEPTGHRTFYGDVIAEDLMITRPLGAPSVFGYFPSSHRPGTAAFTGLQLANDDRDLVAPETKVYSGAAMIEAFNSQFDTLIEHPGPADTCKVSVAPNFADREVNATTVPGTHHLQQITLHLAQFQPATSSSIVEAVDQVLFGYGMSPTMRNLMTSGLTGTGMKNDELIRMAFMSALASPEYAVQR